MSKYAAKGLTFFGILFLLVGVSANSSSPTTIDGFMCNAYNIFSGALGKTFAMFAIVALGVGFFLGKVSWGTAIAIALGIGAIFGAIPLVKTITGDVSELLCDK